MTDNLDRTPSNKTNSTSKPTKQLTRRRIIFRGSVGIAGLTGAIAAGNLQANTQKPVTPETGKADPKGKFAGKVMLITGATSGIGEATARAFAKEGAIVHFCGRREALGEKVAHEIKAQGGRARFVRSVVPLDYLNLMPFKSEASDFGREKYQNYASLFKAPRLIVRGFYLTSNS